MNESDVAQLYRNQGRPVPAEFQNVNFEFSVAAAVGMTTPAITVLAVNTRPRRLAS